MGIAHTKHLLLKVEKAFKFRVYNFLLAEKHVGLEKESL